MMAEDSKPPISRGLELAPGVFVAEGKLRLQYARSSGPGGQNVNKVNTKTELWVAIAAITGLTENARARLTQMAGSRLTLAGEIHIACHVERVRRS